MKTFLKKNWKSCLLAFMAGVIIWLIPSCFNSKTAEAPDVVQVPQVTEKDVRTFFPETTKSEAKDIVHQITVAKEEKAPEYHYYTINQQAADTKAQEIAKNQKADKVIKETEVIPIEGVEDKSVIENNYYGIHLERKHSISVGAAVIDREPYTNVKYRNRDIEYEVYYGVRNNEVGAGISYTVAKW